MNRQRLAVVLLAIATIVVVLPTPSHAVPVFARKYGFECTMCHSAVPRLNDFGARFRQNGYQLPGREKEERTVLHGPAPFAARVSAGWNVRKYADVPPAIAPPTDVNQLQLNSLDLLSAGVLGKNIGYFVIYVPEIKERSGVVGQEGTLEMANVVFSNIGTTWFNVRAGRMEPAYVAMSSKRRLSFTPYAIYEYAFPGGLALSDTQTGVEVYGQARWAASGFALGYAAGYMNGVGSTQDESPADYYGRAYVVIGAGEGQTAGQRIGLVAYQGKATPTTQGDRASFTRYGLDASLNVKQWNLALQYVRGTDSKELWSASKDGTFWGGFAELSWQPMTRLVAFARYDVVNIPDFTDTDLNAPDLNVTYPTGFTIGARYYLVDQLALHGEYSNRSLDFAGSSVPDEKETFYTLGLDFAF